MKIQPVQNGFTGALCSALLFSMSAVAGPGDGIHVKDWELRPYVTGMVEFDDNVRLEATDEDDDRSLQVDYGVEVNRDGANAEMSGRIWGVSQRYDDLDDFDHDDWGDEIRLGIETDGGTVFELFQAYSDVEDVSYQNTSIESFEQHDIAASVSKDLTEKISLVTQYAYTQKDYDTEDLFDFDEHLGRLDLVKVLTGKSDLYVAGEIGQQDSDGNTDEATV